MKKTVFITGASRGIGRAAALCFAKNDFGVAICYNKNLAAANEVLAEITALGGNAAVFKADVSNMAEISAAVQGAKKTFGTIDVLINNAGIAQQKVFSDITEEDWDNMFDINVKGMFNCCKCTLDDMIDKKCGKIINISSIWGIAGASCEVHYSAAKAAVIGFTKALAKELAPSGICVNCVAPGVIKTDMLASFDECALAALSEETPLGRLGTPEDIANVLLFLASDKADFITGQVISPNGGFVI
ncbi:MAG: 3-oxoacyl-ACP reductase FabG [Clostridia bacterium]|nr:3-oxoacyl-ACP reductase FabG [Clostridia bacterium]